MQVDGRDWQWIAGEPLAACSAFDPHALGAGAPLPPRRFSWRGQEVVVQSWSAAHRSVGRAEMPARPNGTHEVYVRGHRLVAYLTDGRALLLEGLRGGVAAKQGRWRVLAMHVGAGPVEGG